MILSCSVTPHSSRSIRISESSNFDRTSTVLQKNRSARLRVCASNQMAWPEERLNSLEQPAASLDDFNYFLYGYAPRTMRRHANISVRLLEHDQVFDQSRDTKKNRNPIHTSTMTSSWFATSSHPVVEHSSSLQFQHCITHSGVHSLTQLNELR